MDENKPADPDKGFPNPHADHFDGDRTPAEQAEFERQEAERQVAAPAGEPAPGLPSDQA